MMLRVVAEPAAEFETWLAQQAQPAVEDRGGRRRESGVFGELVRQLPPHLGHAGRRERGARSDALDEPRDDCRRASAEHAEESADVGARSAEIKPGCLMPAFGLSDEEEEQIVEYLRTLK